MADLIDRQAAIDAIEHRLCEPAYQHTGEDWYAGMNCAECELYDLPSAQPERTVYIPDTKAVRSIRDCVDLSERVSATFYDEEHEEWTQRTVTIADVLDSVCDDYTILPITYPPEIIMCKDCKHHGTKGEEMRLIDANAFRAWFESHSVYDEFPVGFIMGLIDEQPTVDAVPVVHGRWTADESTYTDGEAQCSVCKTTYYADDLYEVGEQAQSELPNYCPHCGARMDAE